MKSPIAAKRFAKQGIRKTGRYSKEISVILIKREHCQVQFCTQQGIANNLLLAQTHLYIGLYNKMQVPITG